MLEVPEAVRIVLISALQDNQRQLGAVYRIDPEMKLKALEIVEQGGAANSGAVANIRCAIRAVLYSEIPTSPTVARQVIGAINGLRRDNQSFAEDVIKYLDEVTRNLNVHATSKIYREEEAEDRQVNSNEMLRIVESRGGVYAYSLPHYLNYPCKEDPDRYWYKVGRAGGSLKDRVINIHRQTGLPEDPIIRRCYFSASLQPKEMEDKLHHLLSSSGLQTESVHGGVEWFATSEDQLDAFAEVLGFEISKPDEDYL